MAEHSIKFPHDPTVVQALAAFVEALEEHAAARLSVAEFNYAAEDGRIGGLLGVRVNMEFSDEMWDEIDDRMNSKGARRLRKFALNSDV